MSDGPFRNLPLGPCWKPLLRALGNDAYSVAECVSHAHSALHRELATPEHRAALRDLDRRVAKQLDLDPGWGDAILDRRETTPFLDDLKRNLRFQTATHGSHDAVPIALTTTIAARTSEIQSHIEEYLIKARESREMDWETCQKARTRVHAVFQSANPQLVADSLQVGDRNAFKEATRKRDGIDEGPRL